MLLALSVMLIALPAAAEDSVELEALRVSPDLSVPSLLEPDQAPWREMEDGTLSTPEEMRAVADAFMRRLVETGDTAGAFHLLRRYFPVSDESLRALIDEAESSLQRIEAMFGAPFGYTLVEEEAVQDILFRLTFLETFERNVFRWELVFYRTSNTWMLKTIIFDEEIDPLFTSAVGKL